jgi:hypothetical protein
MPAQLKSSELGVPPNALGIGWFEARSVKPTSEGLLPSPVQHHKPFDLRS